MLRRTTYYGIAIGLLSLAVAVAGCAPTSGAAEVALEEPAVAPATEQNEAVGSAEAPAVEQADELSISPAVDEGVQVVSAFAAGSGELPEGITIDKSGNIYVSVGYPFWFPVEESFGEIWKINPDGEKTVLHTFPGGPGAAGLAVSPSGELYFAYPNPMDPTTNGVYRLTDEGDPERQLAARISAWPTAWLLQREGISLSATRRWAPSGAFPTMGTRLRCGSSMNG